MKYKKAKHERENFQITSMSLLLVRIISLKGLIVSCFTECFHKSRDISILDTVSIFVNI